jgi:hypothetical protein
MKLQGYEYPMPRFPSWPLRAWGTTSYPSLSRRGRPIERLRPRDRKGGILGDSRRFLHSMKSAPKPSSKCSVRWASRNPRPWQQPLLRCRIGGGPPASGPGHHPPIRLRASQPQQGRLRRDGQSCLQCSRSHATTTLTKDSWTQLSTEAICVSTAQSELSITSKRINS